MDVSFAQLHRFASPIYRVVRLVSPEHSPCRLYVLGDAVILSHLHDLERAFCLCLLGWPLFLFFWSQVQRLQAVRDSYLTRVSVEPDLLALLVSADLFTPTDKWRQTMQHLHTPWKLYGLS